MAEHKNKDVKYTWLRNKQKEKSAMGFLDFVLTKNLKVQEVKVGDFQGNSDHRALEIKLEYKGTIKNRILSKVNRNLLKNYTTDYQKKMNRIFRIKPETQPCTIYDEMAKHMQKKN